MKKILLTAILPILLLGCNGLIYPVSYEVNIRAYNKEDKRVTCDSKIIKNVNSIILKRAWKLGYRYSEDEWQDDFLLKNNLVLHNKYDVDKALFFRNSNFHIEIRGSTAKDDTQKLGMEILKALKEAYPEYKFKYEAK
ncbi:MAG: hypothetical protein GY750_08455 [Lentisphaerae bacterium]|nr:hypothetical protein [Lentisphaerota bacterium]MCP4101441.1 hypothetical protein [Lentisphaerota bacterium]